MAGDWLVYTTKKKQLMKMRLNKEKKDELGKLSYIMYPFHRGKITAIATCMKQPLLVTASDQSLFMWHYNGPANPFVLINAQRLDGQIHALALHTSGHYIIVSLIDKIQIYSILIGDGTQNPQKPYSV